MPWRDDRSIIVRMYWDHMDGWWAWMVFWPLVWMGSFAVVIYVAVRLGVRDGKRDQS
ncbi:MAG: hypothetical protein NZL88_09110 [Gaiellaceae bacterium]|nr:hypothetical protein [Gaiellaceae bacterium]